MTCFVSSAGDKAAVTAELIAAASALPPAARVGVLVVPLLRL
jgi:hypothetical protein